MTQIKILHIITELALGGAQENTLLTVRGLDRDIYEVHLAASPGGEWQARGRKYTDELHVVPSMRRGIHAFQNTKALFEIIQLIREHDYQIVHTHSTNAGLLGRVAGKLTNVPVVIHTVHGFGFDDLTFSPLTRQILIQLERISAFLSDRLIMVADLNKRQALEMNIAPKEKLVTIHSGIDLAEFQNDVDQEKVMEQIGVEGGQPVIGWVGRMSEQNAPEVFIKAAMRVIEAYPTAQFVVVGDGHLRTKCEGLSRGIDNFQYLGFRDDVPQLLSVFDIFVSTVRWAGLGRALTEAMIMGLPVVTTPANGVPEIVEDQETGLLTSIDDPDDIAQKISYLLDHPDIAGKLGKNARDKVVPEFSAELMVERTEDLYDELLREKRIR